MCSASTSPGSCGSDEAAIAAVSQWRFKPGLKDGMPVSVSVDVEVSFRLLTDPRAWDLSRVVFDSPEGTARPVLTSAPYPDMYSPTGETGAVALSFVVDPTGAATNLHIIKSSSMTAESEVSRIVRGWQFRPAMKDGQPTVSGSMPPWSFRAKGNLSTIGRSSTNLTAYAEKLSEIPSLTHVPCHVRSVPYRPLPAEAIKSPLA